MQECRNLRSGKYRALLVPQAPPLGFFLQMDQRGVAVIISDAEFFPAAGSVDFFQQRFVRGRVKVQAAYLIFSPCRVFVRLGYGSQALPQNEHIQVGYFMFPLMTEIPVLSQRQN